MIVSAGLTVLSAAAFGALSPRLARRARPLLALWLLTVGGLATAAACLGVLVTVAVAGLGRLPALARIAQWSPSVMRHANAFTPLTGSLAAAAIGVLAVAALRTLRQHVCRIASAWSTSRSSPPGVVVLRDTAVFAYAVPGWPGRAVVSTALLQELDGPGRQALLAHERVHLREHHELHHLAAAVAASLNPALRALPTATATACERRADEVAAAAVGDRRIVVDAIVRAVRLPDAAGGLAAAGADVALRVAALLDPVRRDRWPLLVPTGLALLSLAALGRLGLDLDAVLDAAAGATGRR